MFGEDFDYGTVDKAVGNFYKCIALKLVNEAKAEFEAKFNAECPKHWKNIQAIIWSLLQYT